MMRDPSLVPVAPEWVSWLMGTQGIHVLAALVGFTLGVIVAALLAGVVTRS